MTVQRLLQIHQTGLFAQFTPQQTVDTHQQLRQVLTTLMDSLTDVEYYDLIELGFYLALVMGRDTEAKASVLLLVDKFGEDASPRIAALKALLAQATRGTGEAIAVLSGRRPNELVALKSRVALSRANSSSEKYVQSLLGFLDVCPLDVETWAELAECYSNMNHLDKAIWSLQEILIIQPFNYYAIARLAEVYHMSFKRDKNTEHLQLSIKHFARSVELCAYFVRGWAGLFLVTKSGDAKLNELAKRQLQCIIDSKSATLADISYAESLLMA